jgi:hypothetical protein
VLCHSLPLPPALSGAGQDRTVGRIDAQRFTDVDGVVTGAQGRDSERLQE